MTLLLSSATGVTAYADESKPRTLLYINPLEYTHSVQLLTPYHDGYWFEQGPLVEPVAFAALQTQVPDLAMCNSSETAETIIKIKPRMFYNPWPGTFFATLVATVYGAGGEELGVFKGEGKYSAPGPSILKINARTSLSRAYALAMQDLMTNFKIKPVAERNKVETVLPCGIIGSQLESRYTIH